jgi:hypothetical protein
MPCVLSLVFKGPVGWHGGLCQGPPRHVPAGCHGRQTRGGRRGSVARMRTEATDPEERALTADGATVRLRDKHVARTAAAAMVPGALLFLLATVAVALGADPAAPRIAALLPFAAFALLTWSLVANSVAGGARRCRPPRRSRCAGWWSTATAWGTSSGRAASSESEVRFRVLQREVGRLPRHARGDGAGRELGARGGLPAARGAPRRASPRARRAAHGAPRARRPRARPRWWATPWRPPSGARRTGSCSATDTAAGAGLGHRAEPLGRGLVGREPLAGGGGAGVVPLGARDAGGAARPVVTDQGAVIDAVPLERDHPRAGPPNPTDGPPRPSPQRGVLDRAGGRPPGRAGGLGAPRDGLGRRRHGRGDHRPRQHRHAGPRQRRTGAGQGYGAGAGRGLRERRAAGPTVRAAPPTVQASLSPEAIRRVVLRNLGQVPTATSRASQQQPRRRRAA